MAPVMKAASAEARKKIAAAISSAVPQPAQELPWAMRSQLQVRLSLTTGKAPDERRVDDARADGVHAHTVRGVVHRELTGECDHAAFGCRVGRTAPRADQPRTRRNVDDAPAARPQQRHQVVCRQIDRPEIHRQNAVPRRPIDLLNGAADVGPALLTSASRRPKRASDCSRGSDPGGFVGDVRLERHEVPRGQVDPFDGPTGGREAGGGGVPNSSRRARDEHDARGLTHGDLFYTAAHRGRARLPDAAGWEAWLAAQHAIQSEAWLRIARRHSGIASVTVTEALDVALCYGWIDGHRKANDDVSFLQRYSRRRPKARGRASTWARSRR